MSGKALALGARYRELIAAINEADRRYYVDDAPTLTDAEYDALRAELNALEAAHLSSLHQTHHPSVLGRAQMIGWSPRSS